MRRRLIFLTLLIFFLTTNFEFCFSQSKAIEKFRKKAQIKKTPKKPPAVLPEKKEETEKKPVAKKEEKEIAAIVFKVKKTDYKESIPILGTISPFEKVELKFEESGRVKKIYVKEGSKVKKDEVLAELEESKFILEEEYAKNKYESEKSLFYAKEKEFNLKKRLYEKGAILKEKLEEIKFELDSQKFKMLSAQKEWELAKEKLKKTKLTAPSDGIIDEKEIEVGEFVSPQDKVFTLIKVNKVYAEVGINEKEVPKIKQNLPAIVKISAYPTKQFYGKVKRIYPSLKGFSRTLTVKIELDNSEGKLFPGMFLKGEIILVSFKNVHVVPAKTILPLGPGFYALPIVKLEKKFSAEEIEKGEATGTIELRKIQVLYIGEEYAAVSGVKEDELVVYQITAPRIEAGKKVKIVNIITYEE